MQRIVFSLLFIIAIACKSATPVSEQIQSLEAWVKNNLGEDITIQKNANATFALCVQETAGTKSTAYYIVRISDFKIVERDTLQPASLSWLDNQRIEIKFIPGIVTKDESTIPSKIIDISKYIINKL
jgi:hypothetical protein